MSLYTVPVGVLQHPLISCPYSHAEKGHLWPASNCGLCMASQDLAWQGDMMLVLPNPRN